MGNVLSLGLSIAFPVVTGAAIGISLREDVSGWYKTLKKPRWNPPAWVFGPVWTVLYSAMGVAAWRVWKAGGGALPLGLYGAQLALNFAWSPIFFKAKNLKLACADITALLGVVAATIVEFHRVDPASAYLLLPYLAWSAFATALTYNICLNNTQGGGRLKKAAAEGAAKAQGAAAAAGETAQKAASEATAAAATPFLAQANERQSSSVPKEE